MADGIEEIVDVQISIQDSAVTQKNFGRGLILGSSGKLTAKQETFSNAAAVAEVFTPGDPELTMANAYFGQEVRPVDVVIAQRDVDEKQKSKINVSSVLNNTLYTTTLNLTAYSFMSGGAATAASIVDGLVAAILGNEPVVLIDNGDNFDIEANVAGDPFTVTTSVNLLSQVVLPNKNIETELAAIEQLNSDWYALFSADHTSKNIKRAANFIQARPNIYLTSSQASDIINSEAHVLTLDFDADFVAANTIDLDIDSIPITQVPFNALHTTTLSDLATEIQSHPSVDTATVTGARQITITMIQLDVLIVVDSIVVVGGISQANGSVTTIIDPTTDLGSELKALSLDRTELQYGANADTEFPEAAWGGGRLPLDPGSQTWAFKTLSLVTVDSLTSSQQLKARNNNVNTYTEKGGRNITQNGTMASGRFIDTRRGVDFVKADQETRIFSQIANLPKIPYTDAGVGIIENEISASLTNAIDKGIFRADPAPTIFVPKVSEVSVNDRANRLLPDVRWQAELAGAIHKVIVRGVVSV